MEQGIGSPVQIVPMGILTGDFFLDLLLANFPALDAIALLNCF
jgi:hypothetical protein